MRAKRDVEDGSGLEEDGADIVPFLYRLRRNESHYNRRIIETIRLVLRLLSQEREEYGSASSCFWSKTVPSQGRNRNIDKASLFVVAYSTYEWTCFKERLLETKRLKVIEAARTTWPQG